MNFTVHRLAALTDNYIWLIEAGDQAWVVDPGEAQPVLDQLSKLNLTLAGVLLTHHHYDHTDGVEPLLQSFPQARLYASALMKKSYITDSVKEGDRLSFEGFELHVLETPGHTLDHIVFYNDQALFSGDTLFAGGCGRVFEGTAEQMSQSLLKLRKLDDSLKMYCGHEYTLANMNFARIAEPNNITISQRRDQVRDKTRNQQACVPSELGLEKQTNPFLRFDFSPLADSLKAKICNTEDSMTSSQLFQACRSWKDQLDKTDILDDRT
jgi:hydroxyacylglutathione hydrolase